MSDISITFHALPARSEKLRRTTAAERTAKHLRTICDTHVPAVGDGVVLDGAAYVVERRTWRHSAVGRSVDVILRSEP